MSRWLIVFFLLPQLFALEITLNGAKENFQSFSILHIDDPEKFLCQEVKNDFDVTTKVVCAFSKQPSKKIRPLQNDFFKISTQTKRKTFFLIIEPHHKIKVFPMIFDLSKDQSFFDAQVKLTNRWMLVGYRDKLPYISQAKPSDTSINFPYHSDYDLLPYVGGLDLKGNPVQIKRVGDVTEYIKIKKLYERKKYDACLDLIEEVEEEYPNSLFMSELLFYKIRVYSKLSDFDNVIDKSKIFLREFSADENVPEVLALTAKAYSKIGLSIDADYFFDRLFDEHKDSEYLYWGYIYKAEMLEQAGDSQKALKFYLMALHETGEIDIAAKAAYNLANYYIIAEQDEAAKYIAKILKAKPDYLMNDYRKSLDMMESFADEGNYLTAAAMAKAITDEIKRDHDDYERLLKDRALWLSQSDEKLEALAAIEKYMKEYPYGEYEEQIQIAKDALFFDTLDQNKSHRLAKYDELIQEYAGDSIGDKAIYQKAKLLLHNGMYSDVLGFQESILNLDSEKYTDTKQIVQDAAIGLMKDALKQRECNDVLVISADYNITLSSEWDNGVYECSMKGGDYALARNAAQRNLHAKDLDERKKWLYRYIKVDFATGNYSDVLDASKELASLISEDQNSPYLDVYRVVFDTYQRLENQEGMIESLTTIEDKFGQDYKDLDRYIAVMTIGADKSDDNLVISYGSKVLDIQQSSGSNPQSPFVEFTLYQSYINEEELDKALSVIKSLDSVILKPKQRARQKYLEGTVLSKLWRDDEAQSAYDEAIEAAPDSAWAKLAKDAKDI